VVLLLHLGGLLSVVLVLILLIAVFVGLGSWFCACESVCSGWRVGGCMWLFVAFRVLFCW